MKRRITTTLSLTLLSLCCSLGLARADAMPDAVERCDRAAGDRYDKDLRSGTELVQPYGIDVAVALPACHDAVAADPGDRRLQYQYGRALMWARSEGDAKPWLDKAASAGSAAAMAELGRWYAGRQTPEDLAIARGWYDKGAALGDTSAMLSLGALFEGGRGVNRDDAAARLWYEKAFMSGDDRGALRLGLLFESGKSSLKDFVAAREWFRKGADAGNRLAMENLGRMYAQGIGGGQDVEAARSVYAAAAAKGSQLAKNRLDDLRKGEP